jgi:hypothetical protein
MLLVLGLSGTRANAADDSDMFGNDADAPAPAAKKSYRKAIKDGVSEYEAHHFEEALSYFRRAHQIYPNARTFRGIGMASFELRDYVTAVRSLTAAVDDQRKPLSAEQRKETQDLIDRCRLFVAVYSVQVAPRDAQVTIDANPLELEPDGKLMLGLGEHTIEARLKGYRTRVLKLQVRGGERKELELPLDPVSGPATRSPLVTTAGATFEPSVPTPLPPLLKSSALPWLVAGGAAAVLSASAGVYWSMQATELSSCRNRPAGLRCTDESALVLQRNMGIATTLVTGAAAATFVTIGIIQRRAEISRSGKTELACAPGLLSVTCAGRF